MKKAIHLIIVCLFACHATNSTAQQSHQKTDLDKRWGDCGDGTYANPVLNADYSDPDVIRVGNMYYMVSSDFHFMGLPVLESKDMINWTIIAQLYDRLNFPEYNSMERYGGGSWAPAIRYHDKKFRVYFCTPNEGLFLATATNAAGPWSPLVHIRNVSGWEDPCPFWDDNGDAYLGRSQLGGGPIILHRMSADGTQLLDEGKTIYEGPTAEGTKLFKKDGSYYLSIPEGGVSTGWQTVLRADNIYGPYEKRVVLEQGETGINGPHQGAFVDTPEGEWWFYHFQSKDPQGRVVHLQPVIWTSDGFPVAGVDHDGNGIGEPVKTWAKPNTGKPAAITAPQSSDEFSSSVRGLQWQFNHNPVDSNWSLTERPGYLRLKALSADKLRNARNSFTQKITGYSGEAITELDCRDLVDGQRAGLLCSGNKYNAVGVERKNGRQYIYYESDGQSEQIVELMADIVYLKASLNGYSNLHQLYYSVDGESFTPCKSAYSLHSGDWKGARIGLFSYNTEADAGNADFNYFTYVLDGADRAIFASGSNVARSATTDK